MDMVFSYLQLQSEEEKNINLLLQTSVQISDNFFKIKKEEMENFLIGISRELWPNLRA